MQIAFYSLITGIVFGIIVAVLKLPIPAPTAFSGILGIVGLYLGYKIIEWII